MSFFQYEHERRAGCRGWLLVIMMDTRSPIDAVAEPGAAHGMRYPEESIRAVNL